MFVFVLLPKYLPKYLYLVTVVWFAGWLGTNMFGRFHSSPTYQVIIIIILPLTRRRQSAHNPPIKTKFMNDDDTASHLSKGQDVLPTYPGYLPTYPT